MEGLTLNSPTSSLPKVGAVTAGKLIKANLKQVSDLLFYLPKAYQDFSQIRTIATAEIGETITIKATVKNITKSFNPKTRKSSCQGSITDGTGIIKVIWFNQPYIADQIKTGQELLFAGTLESYANKLQLTNPIFEPVEKSVHTSRIVPSYKLPEKIGLKTFRNLIYESLPAASQIPEELPLEILGDLPPLSKAVPASHFPENFEELKKARQRFTFDEALIEILAHQIYSQKLEKQSAPVINAEVELIKQWLSKLPFNLTTGQKRALWDIMKDINSSKPMNRLLEGDVGSGKTLIAFFAMLLAAKANKKSVLLAPTQILAKQHYDNLNSFLNRLGLNFNATLLTAAQSKTLKTSQLEKAEIVIATHAILYNQNLPKFGLVIVDEQHRFGVQQRALLLEGQDQFKAHLLSMSATPIPRTLALSIFSDLSISTLKEKPGNRPPIKTVLFGEENRESAYSAIIAELKKGHQAYIITPLVEEGLDETVKSAKLEYESLSKTIFKGYALGLIHGKLKANEKEEVMENFAQKKIQVLVATSVIEVGIDVPNTTIILIEGAEKYGLAQLHQLRGRVGRSDEQSYCLLFTSPGKEVADRLQYFAKNQDGFALAEYDLKARGFGTIFGSLQSGHSKLASDDPEILAEAKVASDKLLALNPNLDKFPTYQRRVSNLLQEYHPH